MIVLVLASSAIATPATQAVQMSTAPAPIDDTAGWAVIDAQDSSVIVRLPCKESELQAKRGSRPVLYCAKQNFTAQLFNMDFSKSSFDEFVTASDKESASLGGEHSAFVSHGHRFATEHFVKGGVEYFTQIIEISKSKGIMLGLMSKDLGNKANDEIARKIFASVEFADK